MPEDSRKITIQVRTAKTWETAAEVLLTGSEKDGANAETRFEYDIDYALQYKEKSGSRAVSCLFPINFEQKNCSSWPSFLLDLFPQGAALKYIVEHYKIADTAENYWKILKTACLNPPGNVRILNSKHLENIPTSHSGFTREEILQKGANFLEYMIENGAPVAGTTGAGGAAPKFLLREDHRGLFHADGALQDTETKECWLVKYPRGYEHQDRLILETESKYLKIAKKVGLKVDRLTNWEKNCLFVPRFDRKVGALEINYWGLESFYSLVGSTEFGSRLRHETYLDAIQKFSSTPQEDAIEYVFRDFLNIMMGNTDNHGRNSSLIKHNDLVSLAPLYDFAPMKFDSESIVRNTRWNFQVDADPFEIAEVLERKNLVDTHSFRVATKIFYDSVKNLDALLKDTHITSHFIEGTRQDREFLLAAISRFLR